jgi:uncharacterized protein YhdP
LGVKVSIGNLDTLSTDWLPSLEITDFVLRDAADQEVLHLPRVLVSLSPTSLLTLSLDRVDIDSPLIEVTRDSEGQLRIAGLSMGQAQPSALADWFWSQPEIFVHRGRLRWVDQKASLPAVELQEVNVALRNGLRSHDWRIDATPPPEWGARFSLQGRFHQPLLSRHASDLQTWDGDVYAAFSQIDLAPIQPYLSFVLATLCKPAMVGCAVGCRCVKARWWRKPWTSICRHCAGKRTRLPLRCCCNKSKGVCTIKLG